jgi:hypothetical protein
MTFEARGICLLLLLFVAAAVLISQAVAPQNDSEIRPRIVKTIAVNVNEEAGL